MELTVVRTKECWKCSIELKGDGEVHQGHCPRCAVLLDGLLDLRELTQEEVDERKSWQAAIDLGLLYRNWSDAYIRLMNEMFEPDYSSLDDFITEVMEHSFLYLKRLQDEKLLRDDSLSYIRGILNESTLAILDVAERLRKNLIDFGEWKVKDEEIRVYWLEQVGIYNSLIQSHTTSPKALQHQAGGKK